VKKPNTLPVCYGVYTAEGRLLGIWETLGQAQSFLHPGFGREIRQMGPIGIWPTVSAETYRRDKLRTSEVTSRPAGAGKGFAGKRFA